jgi:HK97 gp10 family phage protein
MRLEGISKLMIDLKKYGSDKEKGVINALNATGLDVQRVATKLAPVNKKKGKGGGILKNSNTFKAATKSRPTIEVGNKAKYAPYQEFGTGSKVRVPKGYEDVAIKHKGIGLRSVNLKPQPYLVPAIELSTPKLIERIKKLFK